MSEGSGKSKKKAGFNWWSDWAIGGILGGFGLVYLALIALDAHPLHWLFSGVGGVVGYGVGLLVDAWRPRLRRRARPGPRTVASTQRRKNRGSAR